MRYVDDKNKGEQHHIAINMLLDLFNTLVFLVVMGASRCCPVGLLNLVLCYFWTHTFLVSAFSYCFDTSLSACVNCTCIDKAECEKKNKNRIRMYDNSPTATRESKTETGKQNRPELFSLTALISLLSTRGSREADSFLTIGSIKIFLPPFPILLTQTHLIYCLPCTYWVLNIVKSYLSAV